MFGYSGDDLANFWGLIGFGVALAAIGLSLSDRVWRRVFFALAAAFALSGLFWSIVKKAIPALVPILSHITSNPTNWFVCFVLLVVALWIRQVSRQLASLQKASGEVGSASDSEMIDSEISFRQGIETRFKGIQSGLEAIWQDLNSRRSIVEQLDNQITRLKQERSTSENLFPKMLNSLENEIRKLRNDFLEFVTSASTKLEVAHAIARLDYIQEQQARFEELRAAIEYGAKQLATPAAYFRPRATDELWLIPFGRAMEVARGCFANSERPLKQFDPDVEWAAVDGDEIIEDALQRRRFRFLQIQVRDSLNTLYSISERFQQELSGLRHRIKQAGAKPLS